MHTDLPARVTHSCGLWKHSKTHIYIFCIHLFTKTLTECLPNSNLVLTVLVDTGIHDWSVHRPFGRLGHLSLWNEFSCYLMGVKLVTVESLGYCWWSPVTSCCSWEWTSRVAFCVLEEFQGILSLQWEPHFTVYRRSWVTFCNLPDVCVYSFLSLFLEKYDEKQKDSSSPLFPELFLVLPHPKSFEK